ncbi:acylsugar acyltransferase 3-like [Lycium barbarum]|uniref:acylsugar acyltransferase 3-like n=1 Tax=Lycium barbarum TaxID=112863 RepID=UPI00293F52B3|nr:acylsugar acyltransferase 3-like [Lycium barbarum]
MVESTILSRKIIKPSSSTPSSCRRHNLSFIDHISTPAYAPIAAFYSKPANYNISKISQIVENSLSKVLTSYYPFSGRIVDNKYVDCNDTGAQYLNVRISCPMYEVLNNPYNDAADVVFPQDLPWSNTLDGNLLVAQLSHFVCGGIAISVCVSHKIVDGYSLSKFLNDWAATSRNELDFKPSAQFDAASFFPLMDDPPFVRDFVREPQQCLSRTYNFSSSNLRRLKDIVATNSEVQNPTRVEVALALLHKCVLMANFREFKPFLLSSVMNIRPTLPLINTIGNATCFFSSATTTEDEIQVPHAVARVQKAKQHLRDKLKDTSSDQIASHALESIKAAANSSSEILFCSSLCNFGLYKTDFGWGKPIRVTLPSHPMKNNIIFLDDPSGQGIDALITLKETDMLIFQVNKELLEFASPLVPSPEFVKSRL